MGEELLHIISDLLQQNPDHLTPMSAGVLAAAYSGLANDSRSLASKLGLAHALVLRECVALSEEQNLIALQDNSDRSQRLFFSLTQRGHELVAETDSR